MAEQLINNKRGIEILHDATANKSTAFTEAEREKFGLVGLVIGGSGCQRDGDPHWQASTLYGGRCASPPSAPPLS